MLLSMDTQKIVPTEIRQPAASSLNDHMPIRISQAFERHEISSFTRGDMAASLLQTEDYLCLYVEHHLGYPYFS